MNPEDFHKHMDKWKDLLVDAVNGVIQENCGKMIDSTELGAVVCTLFRITANMAREMSMEAFMTAAVIAWEEAESNRNTSTVVDEVPQYMIFDPKNIAKA